MSVTTEVRDFHRDQLHERGYTTVDFGLPQEFMADLFDNIGILFDDAFDPKNSDGHRIVESLSVSIPSRPGYTVGSIDRRRIGEVSPYDPGSDPATEDKDQFHHTPQTNEAVDRYFRGSGGAPAILRGVLAQCDIYHREVAESVRPVASALGLEYYLLAERLKNNVHMNRFLFYPPVEGSFDNLEEQLDLAELIQSGKPIGDSAELHLDRNRLTVASYKDAPGLVGAPANNRFGRPDITLEEFDLMAQTALNTPIPYVPGKADVFAGAGINHVPLEILSQNDRPEPLLHGVRGEANVAGRRSAVTFLYEHKGIEKWPLPGSTEKGFWNIRNDIEANQLHQ